MGIQLFSRERLLGRNIDFLRLAWIWQFAWGRFSGRGEDGRYPSVRGWYAQVWALLPRLRLPAAVLMVSLVAAAIGGVAATNTYPIPPEMLQQFRTAAMQDKLAVMQETMRQLPLFIFSHNVRAMGLTAVLGTLTFGVASVAIFMLPWGVISFATAQLATVGESPFLFLGATVLPHAIVELPAILLIVAAALRWQAIIISPPGLRTVGEEWLEAGADFMRIYIGLGIPLLFIAAVLESFVTPAMIVWAYGG
jgi:stage II sporulation protein M